MRPTSEQRGGEEAMSIIEIRNMPRSMTCSGGTHESVFRAYHIVEKLRDLLKRNVPADVLLELLDEMEGKATS